MIAGRTGNLFGHHTHMRLASIAAFLARNKPEDADRYDSLSPTQFLHSMIASLQTVRTGVAKVTNPRLWRLDVLLEDGYKDPFNSTKWKLKRPKVVMDFDINNRGGLSVMWHPSHKDFRVEELPYYPAYSGRPLNEFLYFREFTHYANQVRNPRLEEWERAIVGHLIYTFKGIMEEIVKEVGEYCEVRLERRIELIRDRDDKITGWETINQVELDGRARLKSINGKRASLDAIQAHLDEVLVKRGLTGIDLVGHVNEMRATKVPYATIERRLVESGTMYALGRGETLKDIVMDLRKVLKRRDDLTEELNALI